MKLYGSVNNRFDENKMYCKKIEVGTGATIYHYSDRDAYEVVEVIDQKHVFIREYDHKGIGQPMSNQWELISNENNRVRELVFRYNHWNEVTRYTKEIVNRIKERDGFFRNEREILSKLETQKEVKVYDKINISFGVADYYFDYEF